MHPAAVACILRDAPGHSVAGHHADARAALSDEAATRYLTACRAGGSAARMSS